MFFMFLFSNILNKQHNQRYVSYNSIFGFGVGVAQYFGQWLT